MATWIKLPETQQQLSHLYFIDHIKYSKKQKKTSLFIALSPVIYVFYYSIVRESSGLLSFLYRDFFFFLFGRPDSFLYAIDMEKVRTSTRSQFLLFFFLSYFIGEQYTPLRGFLWIFP
jgi:hypothetical protein